MKIRKIGHCCLYIEEGELNILTDPGSLNKKTDNEKKLDVVLITHEHQDHLHMDSLKVLIKNNPDVCVITNQSVGKILAKEGIKFVTVENGQGMSYKDVKIEGFGNEHAVIYKTMPAVQNTGYFVGNRLFYPGDAFFNPGRKVEILALPVAGPWMKISEALDYAKEIMPKACFPVHDGMIRTDIQANFSQYVAESVLKPAGIEFTPMSEGSIKEF